MLRCLLVMSALAFPAITQGQSSVSTSYTRMILGGGVGRYAPTFTLGFEVKRAKSPLTWRLMSEYSEQSVGEPFGGGYFSTSSSYGIQLLGVRTFRESKRFQPYVLAGGGVDYTYGQYTPVSYRPDSSGYFNPTIGFPRRRQTVEPAFIWGTGMNLRLSGLTLFSELKLPIYSGNAFKFGPYAPLTFGIRF